MIDNSYNNKDLTAQQLSGMNAFEVVTIKVASPDVIRSWSHGEVKNPETFDPFKHAVPKFVYERKDETVADK